MQPDAMGEQDSPLEVPFGHFRFLGKSFAVFCGILIGLSLLKDFSKPIDDARQLLYAEWWGLPLLFAAWLPLHLFYEVLLIHHRKEIEARRKPQNRASKRRFAKPPPKRRQ